MSIILGRRSFLTGVGTVLALPSFESVARAADKPPVRFMTFHFPIGVNRAAWAPSGTEQNWTLGQSQAPLAARKNDICVITGVNLSGNPSATAGHTCGIATFLTARDTPPGITSMGTSADQMIAQSLAGKTAFSSLQLGTSILRENPNAEPGYSPVLKDNLSWANGTPLPKEVVPSTVFDRIFAGKPGGETAAALAKRKKYQQSVLDSVRTDATALKSKLGKSDNVKLDQYLTGVRELEVRVQSTATTCTPGARPGAPVDIRDRVKQMLDLSILAFTCDLTRVITFGYEHTVTEQAHPFVGVNDGYHIGVTHNLPGAPYAAVNQWIVSQFAYLLDRMDAQIDVDGSKLLDNSIVYFSSELAEGSSHSSRDLPMIVAGRGGGRIVSGRLLNRTNMGNGNVLISLMQAMGVNVTTFGNGFNSPLPGLVTT